MSRQSFIQDFFKSKGSASSSQVKIKVEFEPAEDLPRKAKMRKVRESCKKPSRAAGTSADAVELVDLCSSDDEITVVKTEESPANLSQMSTTSADSQKTVIYGTPENVLDFKMDIEEEETIVLSPPMSPIHSEVCDRGSNNIKSLEGSHTNSKELSNGASSPNTVKTPWNAADKATSVSNIEETKQMATNPASTTYEYNNLISKSTTSLNNAENMCSTSAQHLESNESPVDLSLSTTNKRLRPEGLSNSSQQLCQQVEINLNTPQKCHEIKTPEASTSKSSSKTSQNASLSQAIELKHETPQKSTVQSLKTPQSSLSKSGGSSYFSPAKKRKITQKSPTVKRNLRQELEERYLEDLVKREQLVNGEVGDGDDSKNDTPYSLACQDMDDKTIFLLTTINEYLKNQSLSHLLDDDSYSLLLSCFSVVKPGMRVVCRLYWRKEGWYKREQARVIAGGDKEPLNGQIFDEMVQDLILKGFIVEGDTSNISVENLASVLSKDDLMHICKDLKLKVQSKQEAVEALIKFSKRTVDMKNFLIKKEDCFSSNAQRVLSKMKTKGGSLYKLSDKARSVLDRLYMIMYLGLNYGVLQEKNLELILLYDKIQRETYPVDKNMTLDDASVVFKTRHEFESYKSAHDLYKGFLATTEVQRKCAVVQQVYQLYQDLGDDEIKRYTSIPYWLRKYTPGGLYARIMDTGVQELKKDADEGRYLLALNILDTLRSQDLFLRDRKAEWYNEAALILDNKYHRCDEAAEVLLRGFNSDLSEEAKDTLRPRAQKISKKKNTTLNDKLRVELLSHTLEDTPERSLGGQHIVKQPMEYSRSKSRGKQKFETKTNEGRLIHEAEEFCICHYISTGEFTHGEHWEGRIITTIFFLLFWDIIYKKPRNAPGVFLSYFQKYPLDLRTDSFYQNRKFDIDDWIDSIGKASDDKLIAIMRDTWNRRPEHELSGINRTIGWENIRMVSKCLGSRGLQAVCRRLATGYRHCSGFPDLTLWNVNNNRVKFVEVKTDSDTPSRKQIQWMKYLRENGIDTEFCYVGNNTTRQRSRRGAGHNKGNT